VNRITAALSGETPRRRCSRPAKRVASRARSFAPMPIRADVLEIEDRAPVGLEPLDHRLQLGLL
jgi:hypothetical protein